MPKTKKTAAETKMAFEVNKKIGPRVKEARERIGKRVGEDYSQALLGIKLGCTGGMISQIEHGRRTLQREDAEKISELSGLRVEYLLGFDDYPTQDQVINAVRKQIDFYRMWRFHFVDLIAEQLEYQLRRKLEHGVTYYYFTDFQGRTFRVDEKEIMAFLDEYYEYARFKIEQIIDRHKHEFYKKEQDGE